ncbi:MAG: DUF58 domain-containing protein [Dehalococcoidia bacterium]|nr:DUF58 domain-containing protein [Dehalococcoidia bacterium]
MVFRDLWLLAGPVLIGVGAGTGQPMVTGIGVVVLIVGAISRLWARYIFRRVNVSSSLSEARAFQGEQVELRFEIENRKPLPLPWFDLRVAISEELEIEGEELPAASAPGLNWLTRRGALGWYERRRWRMQVSSRERGQFQIGPTQLHSADILGIFPRHFDAPEMTPFIAYPRVFALDDLGFPADRPLGDSKGRNRIFEDPLRIAGLRDYEPGDPLRRIDWKATARHGELQSRVYEPSAVQHLYVLLNIDTLEHSWEGYLKDDLERTVSMAASLAVWATGRRYAVGLLANGSLPNSDRPIRLPPSRARTQLPRILETLAVVQPLTMGDLAGRLRREASRLPLGSTLILAAAFIPDELAEAMRRLQDEGYRVAVVVTSERVDLDKLTGLPVRVTGRRLEASEVLV